MNKPFNIIHKTTFHFLRWVFFLIFVYISAVIGWNLWFSGGEFFEQVISFSVSGFFAFFMGYFGWRLAETIEKSLQRRFNV